MHERIIVITVAHATGIGVPIIVDAALSILAAEWTIRRDIDAILRAADHGIKSLAGGGRYFRIALFTAHEHWIAVVRRAVDFYNSVSCFVAFL